MKINIGPYEEARKVEIEVEDFDTWNADHTLALIIHPVLVKLKEQKHGSPFVENEDAPEELRDNGNDETIHERWSWVLDEIIHAFESLKNEDWDSQFFIDTGEQIVYDAEKAKTENERVSNGLRLFAKYYRGLWT